MHCTTIYDSIQHLVKGLLEEANVVTCVQPVVDKWQPFKFKSILLKLSVNVFGIKICYFMNSFVNSCWLQDSYHYNFASYYIEVKVKFLVIKCKTMQ